jgi:hypothetical protein
MCARGTKVIFLFHPAFVTNAAMQLQGQGDTDETVWFAFLSEQCNQNPKSPAHDLPVSGFWSSCVY